MPKLQSYLRFAFFILTFSFLIFNSSSAQTKLQMPTPKNIAQCKECEEWFDKTPENIHVYISIDDDRNVVLFSNSVEYFEKLINIGGLKLGVELLTRDMYDCDSKEEMSPNFLGTILNVVDKKYLKKNARVNDNGDVMVALAKVPSNYEAGDFEANLLFIKNSVICTRNIFYNIELARWKLLDMGIFLDTLVNKEQGNFTQQKANEVKTISRTLTFTVPFEKNKFNYTAEDVKPIYDSLSIKGYTITNISIEAYASVEGSEENNLLLQKNRANSIATAIQSYQSDSIKFNIKTEENWSEFYNDIEGTKWDKLSELSKKDAKEKFKNAALLKELEPLFKKHRKAVIHITQERKEQYKNVSNETLIQKFETQIKEKNLSEAQKIEIELFYRILNNKADTNLVDSPTLPEDVEYSILFQNRSAFKYYFGGKSATTMLAEYEKQSHLHDNLRSLYNYYVLVCNAFVENPDERLFTVATSTLKELKAFKLAPSVIEKMTINLLLLQAEYYGYKKEYQARDKAINDLYKKYYKASLSEKDALSFAKYLVSYDKLDASKKMLAPYAAKVNCNEDLLFYYINLTVLDKKVSNSSSYKSVLQNAVNKNKNRFCILYNTPDNRGISFQILNGKLFKKYYCEYCDK